MTKGTSPANKDLAYPIKGNLIGEALAEYHEKQPQIVAELLERAKALINRIMPDYAADFDCYLGLNGNVVCGLEELSDGFGALSLSFHKGETPESDYFLVSNYMELASPIPIYTLYDLGHVLYEITDLAKGVLRSFKFGLLESVSYCEKSDISE